MLEVPAHVERAVFSTFPRPTCAFVTACGLLLLPVCIVRPVLTPAMPEALAAMSLSIPVMREAVMSSPCRLMARVTFSVSARMSADAGLRAHSSSADSLPSREASPEARDGS